MNAKNARRVRKHRNDQNHGKSGFVGGNPRYDRRYPDTARGMGRATCRTIR